MKCISMEKNPAAIAAITIVCDLLHRSSSKFQMIGVDRSLRNQSKKKHLPRAWITSLEVLLEARREGVALVKQVLGDWGVLLDGKPVPQTDPSEQTGRQWLLDHFVHP